MNKELRKLEIVNIRDTYLVGISDLHTHDNHVDYNILAHGKTREEALEKALEKMIISNEKAVKACENILDVFTNSCDSELKEDVFYPWYGKEQKFNDGGEEFSQFTVEVESGTPFLLSDEIYVCTH